MYRCLSSIAKHNFLRYPVKLTKRERPDWLLELGKERIGCEITEAVSSEKLRAESLPEARAEGAVLDVSLFKHGQDQRSLDDLREIAAREKLTGSGWAGDSVEKEYAAIVYDVAQKKTTTLNKEGFEKFDENWLLIYCNYNLPILDQIKAASFCRQTLESYWGSNSFDKIFVEKGDSIACYSRPAHQVIEINDIWQEKLTRKGIGRILRRCF